MKNRKFVAIVVAAMAAMALAFALVGCGGGASNYKENFVGNWKLIEIQSENTDVAIGADDMATMESFGMTVTIALNEDGTTTLDMFGETSEGTWEATSETDCSMKYSDMVGTATLKDGQLWMEDEGDYLVFEKVM